MPKCVQPQRSQAARGSNNSGWVFSCPAGGEGRSPAPTARAHGTAAAHAAHAAPAAQSCSSTNGASIPTGQREYSPLFVLARGRFLAGPCIPPRCPDRGGARINSTGGGTRAQSAGKSVRTTRRGIPGTGNRGVAPVARARAPSGFPFGKYYAILGAVCGCRCVPAPAAFSVALPVWAFGFPAVRALILLGGALGRCVGE